MCVYIYIYTHIHIYIYIYILYMYIDDGLRGATMLGLQLVEEAAGQVRERGRT